MAQERPLTNIRSRKKLYFWLFLTAFSFAIAVSFTSLSLLLNTGVDLFLIPIVNGLSTIYVLFGLVKSFVNLFRSDILPELNTNLFKRIFLPLFLTLMLSLFEFLRIVIMSMDNSYSNIIGVGSTLFTMTLVAVGVMLFAGIASYITYKNTSNAGDLNEPLLGLDPGAILPPLAAHIEPMETKKISLEQKAAIENTIEAINRYLLDKNSSIIIEILEVESNEQIQLKYNFPHTHSVEEARIVHFLKNGAEKQETVHQKSSSQTLSFTPSDLSKKTGLCILSEEDVDKFIADGNILLLSLTMETLYDTETHDKKHSPSAT